MTEHIRLIWRKLDHLKRMAAYLAWSLEAPTLFGYFERIIEHCRAAYGYEHRPES